MTVMIITSAKAKLTKIAKFRSDRTNEINNLKNHKKIPEKFGDIKKMRTFASALDKNA